VTRRGIAGFGVLVVAALAAGCGSSDSKHSVLYQGIRPGHSSHAHRVSDAEAKTAARTTLATWKHELAKRARLAPAQRFDNPSSAALRQRLREDARRYHFRIVSLELLRPRQLAPKIVVQTRDYVALARGAYWILKRIDPRRRVPDDRKGWRYEGFYFEAQDERGIPFFATYTFMRGPGPGGGQWARSEPLYPFNHG
jgi:hypothetical protein